MEHKSAQVINAAWKNGLPNEQLAACLAELAAEAGGQTTLSAMLTDGFVDLLKQSGLPGPILAYLQFVLQNSLLRATDFFAGLIEQAGNIIDAALEGISPVIAFLGPSTPEELPARLRLLRALRARSAPLISAALLKPFAVLDDPSPLPQQVRTEMRELLGGFEEPALKGLADRLDAKVPVISVKRERSPTPALPMELWHGVETVLADGPTEDAELLITNLVSLRCTRIGAGAHSSAAAQLSAFFSARRHLHWAEHLSGSDYLAACLLDLFLAGHRGYRRARPAKSRARVIWSTFLFSRLPALLHAALHLAENMPVPESSWSSACAIALSRLKGISAGTTPSAQGDAMDTDTTTIPSATSSELFIRALASAMAREGLVKEVDMQEQGLDRITVEPADISALKQASDLSSMAEILKAFALEGADGRSLAAQLAEIATEFATAKRFAQLSALSQALTADPVVLDVFLIHDAPSRLLGPFANVIDAFDMNADGGDGQALDHIGSLAIMLQLAIQRYHLGADLRYAIGSEGFCLRWLFSTSSAHHLRSLAPEDCKLVSQWIAALYGESGVSDALISGTNPRSLLHLAPTIVQQSVVARKMGILSADSLKDGLSYFCQDLLSFTLPGVLRWVASELSRLPAGSPMSVILHEALRTLITSQTPGPALELALEQLGAVTNLDTGATAALSLHRSPSDAGAPTAVDALGALHGGSTSARIPALRSALLSASPIERARLMHSTDVAAHILALPDPHSEHTTIFPLATCWAPVEGQEGIAAETLCRVEAYQRALSSASGQPEIKPDTGLVDRWRKTCSPTLVNAVEARRTAIIDLDQQNSRRAAS